jgi:hypothetical protein
VVVLVAIVGGVIAKDAAMAYDGSHAVCPSASLPLPTAHDAIRGTKYQSTKQDWEVDEPRHAGFACLHFSMTRPQYYQYRYEATPSSFLAGGRGDLDGDGKLSDFRIRGEVQDSHLVLTPSIEETDPEE